MKLGSLASGRPLASSLTGITRTRNQANLRIRHGWRHTRAATSSHKTMQEVLFNTPAGSTLQYFKRGKGPIMIVTPPAWGLGTKYLAEAFEPLEQTFTLIYLELRANGKSSRPAASEMSCWHAADDIEHLRQELKLEKIPCLLGHSGGGTIALWYAIRYNKVDRLILLNHRLDGFDDSKSMKEAIVEKAKNPKMHAPLKAWTTSHENLTDEGFAQVIRSFLPIYFYNPDAFYRSKVLSNLQSVSLWNYQTVNGADRQVHQQEPELGKVTAKTLVVSCRADPVCTPAQAIATHKGIAGSKLVIYEKCGHFPWLETDEVFDDIIDFCNS